MRFRRKLVAGNRCFVGGYYTEFDAIPRQIYYRDPDVAVGDQRFALFVFRAKKTYPRC